MTSALRQAFERLLAAGREVGERTVKVAGDDEVRNQAKQAASSLNGALSATVDLIGEQIAGLFSRADKETPTRIPRSTADDPPSPTLGSPGRRPPSAELRLGGYGAAVRPELEALWLLRHGQSLGNVANDASRVVPVDRLDIAERDMDVPLSDLGVEQAKSFGVWLGEQSAERFPRRRRVVAVCARRRHGPTRGRHGWPGHRDRP